MTSPPHTDRPTGPAAGPPPVRRQPTSPRPARRPHTGPPAHPAAAAGTPHTPHPARPATTADPGTVLIVGGTGFIGSAVLKELTHHQDPHATGPALRVLSRHPPTSPPPPTAQHVRGDLAHPHTLRGICAGIKTVIHAASYVGRDPHTCHHINHTGTKALLDDAQRHGVKHFIYISTASVYGPGPHRGPTEEHLTPPPPSPASTTRLHAENAVRAHGGTILRPHLIYGPGDRWFIPTLARMLQHVPTWPDHTPPHTSIIAVQDLARLITALTHHPPPPATTYHAADPHPLPINHLLTHLHHTLPLPPTHPTPLTQHRTQIQTHLPHLTDHQYNLLTQDHYYDTTRIWHHTQLHPGPGFTHRYTTSTPWYTHHLTHTNPAR
ncbi:NAD-dependent epimerase/dehydratase family protein [Streptomyces sp. NPDC002814]